MHEAALFFSERALLFLMLFVLSTIGVITFSERSKQTKEKSAGFCVRVVGEVEEEALVQLHPGATVADALFSATFTECADPQKIAYDVRLVKDQVVVVPKKGALSIFVTGAVEKEELLTFEEEATFLDLRKKIQLQKSADIKAFFRKRRKLKQGETITIAFQK